MSFTELLIIAILALVLLGPDQLPSAARTAGKWMRELRRATEDLKDQIETGLLEDERKPRPSLVPPVPAGQAPAPPSPPPLATAGNVPGLEAALAEPGDAAPPAPGVPPAPAPERPPQP